MLGLKRRRNKASSSVPHPRLHGLADRIQRRELGFANCTMLDAVLAAAGGVQWLSEQPGAIIIADGTGRFLTMVWNRIGFERWADNQSTGVAHGDLVLQPDVPAGTSIEHLRLIVEVPE